MRIQKCIHRMLKPNGMCQVKLHILIKKKTQVGSPAVRLRLVCCTAWVKRWSEAMDFLQTIFKTNIFVLRIFENYIC